MIAPNETYDIMQAEVVAPQRQVAVLEAQMNEQRNQPDYSAFFTHALDMLCIAGFDGYFKHLNPQWSATLGYTNDELLSQPFLEFVHPDDRAATQAEAAKLAATGTDMISFENRYRCSDGSYKYLRWTSRVVPEYQLFYATARDITSEKQTQAELQRLNDELHQSQALLQGLIDNAPSIIYAKDVQRRLWAVNRQFANFMNLEPEQMLGKTDYDLFPHDMAAMFYEQEEEVLRSGQPIGEEQDVPAADGSPATYWNVKFPIFDDQQQIIALAGIATDITQRKRAEEEVRRLNAELEQRVANQTRELRQNQALLQGILDHSPAVISIRDTQGRYMLVNHTFERLFKRQKEQIIGTTNDDILPYRVAEQNRINDQNVVTSRHAIESEEVIPVDGMLRTYLSARFPLINEHGEVYAIGDISTDITERKEAEERLHLTQFSLDRAADVVLWHNNQGQVIYANEAAYHSLGYHREELLTLSISDIDPSFALATMQDAWETVKAQGFLSIQTTYCRKDGSTLPVEMTINAIQYGNENFLCIFARDITERQRQEEALRTFKTVVENANEGIGIVTLDSIFTYANPTAYRMLQYDTDMTGMNSLDIYDEPPEKITTLMQHIIAQGSWQGELVYKRKDGSTFPAAISAFAVHDEQGTVQAMAGIIRDLTEQKRYAETLERLATLIETSSDFIGVASPDGQAIYLNQAGQRLVGLAGEEEYQQTQVIEYFTPEEQERVQRDIMPILMRDGHWKGECFFRHFKTGEAIQVEWNVFFIKNPETGQPTAFATVTRDLREQKQAEAERTRLQQQIIDAQRAALRELSSPLIPITDQVVIMPLIGTIDTQRAQQIMEALLEGVTRHHASAAIIDITGVQVVDTQVAHALIQAAQAVRLLGAQVILTGIGPVMAQTLVGLGIDLSELTTLASLQTGINYVTHNV